MFKCKHKKRSIKIIKPALTSYLLQNSTNLCCTKRSRSLSLIRAGRGELLLIRLNYRIQKTKEFQS